MLCLLNGLIYPVLLLPLRTKDLGESDAVGKDVKEIRRVFGEKSYDAKNVLLLFVVCS